MELELVVRGCGKDKTNREGAKTDKDEHQQSRNVKIIEKNQ